MSLAGIPCNHLPAGRQVGFPIKTLGNDKDMIEESHAFNKI